MGRGVWLGVTATIVALGAFAGTARAEPTIIPKYVPDLVAPVIGAPAQRDQGVESVPQRDPWTTRKRQISAQGGLPGGPLGYGGLSFEYAPIKYLVLGTGGGYNGTGPVGALWPRLRIPVNRFFAFGFGVPVSAGPYQFVASATEQCTMPGCSVAFRTTRTWDIAVWGHIEPNVEFRIANGMALRLYGGYSAVVNSRSDICTSTLANGCPSTLGAQKLYGGFAVGYAW